MFEYERGLIQIISKLRSLGTIVSAALNPDPAPDPGYSIFFSATDSKVLKSKCNLIVSVNLRQL